MTVEVKKVPLRLFGGSKEENDTYLGASRTVTVDLGNDTAKPTLRVHDGVKTGGYRLISEEVLVSVLKDIVKNVDTLKEKTDSELETYIKNLF